MANSCSLDEDSLDSWGEESSESLEPELVESEENQYKKNDEQKKTSLEIDRTQGSKEPGSRERPSRQEYSTKAPKILANSCPLDEDCLVSWGEESIASLELELIEAEENQDKKDDAALDHLSRIGFRHPLWSSKTQSYFVLLSFLLTYDCLVAYMVLFDKYGTIFPVVYGVVLFLVGFPLMYMELALGQYTSSNVFTVFRRMAPAFSGLGAVALLYNFWMLISDQVVVVTFLNLFFSSVNIFDNDLPWNVCSSQWDSPKCQSHMRTCDELNRQRRQIYHEMPSSLEKLERHYRMVGDFCVTSWMTPPDGHTTHEDMFAEWFETEPIESFIFESLDLQSLRQFSFPSYRYYASSLLGWIFILTICLKNKHLIAVHAHISILVMTATLVCFIAVFFFFNPPQFPFFNVYHREPTPLFNCALWSDTVFLILRSMKLGQGGLMFLGAHNPFHNNMLNDCLFVVAVMVIIPLGYSLTHILLVDSALLSMNRNDLSKWHALAKNYTSSYLYRSQQQIVHLSILANSFQIFSHYEPFLVMAFSLMGIFIVLGNKLVRSQMLVDSVVDMFYVFGNEVNRRQILVVFILTAAFSQLLHVDTDGFDVGIGLENITFPMMSASIVILQLFVVCYLYGTRRLFMNISYMVHKLDTGIAARLDQIANSIVLVLWCFVIPAITIFAMVVRWNNEDFDPRTGWFAKALLIIACSIVPTHMAITAPAIPPSISKRSHCHGDLLQIVRDPANWTAHFRPNIDLWGPRHTKDRYGAEKMERQIRDFSL